MEGSEREPLGQRILELPDDLQVFESRDPRSTFTAYVPVGSLAKGEALVAKGGLGKTVACAPCHGSDLKGLEPLPSIAGRSPSYMFRQLYDFRHGARTGEWSPLMAQVVSNLDQEDMLAIVAYLASIGDRLGKTDHQARPQAAGDGSAARAALIVGHLSDDIALREAGEVGVFRPSRPIRAMTKPACEQVRLTAVGNDVRQWPMVARMPDGCDKSVPELGPGIAGRAVWHAHEITVVDRRLVVGIVLRISPSWRELSRRGGGNGERYANDRHALHHHTITPLQTPRTVTHETCREGRHPPRAPRKPRALSTSATAQALEAGALHVADDGHDVGGALVARPARHRANELDRGF